MSKILIIEDEARIRDNPCRFLRLEAAGYVTKPFNLPQLAALIRRRLGDPK